MNVRSFLAAASLGAAIFTAAGAVRADPPPFAAHAEGTRVGLSVDLYPTQDFFLATMGFGAQIAVHRNVGIDLDVPWWVAHTSISGSSGSAALFGDITIGGHGVFRVLPEAALNIGATVSIPTRYDFQSPSQNVAIMSLFASLSRGFYDFWRLAPGVLSIRFPIGFEARFLDLLYYRGELNPVILIPVASGSSGGAQAILEHADELEVRAPFGLGGGVRFQMAFLLTDGLSSSLGAGGTSDHLQTAIEPFVGYEPVGSGLYARVGMLVALDTPLGPGTDKDKLTTVRMQVGGKF
jgi:hypothetical protein